jgi:hypothetical protein
MKQWVLGFLVGAVALVGCTAIRQQKAAPPVADSASYHNLQVLPANITHDQLIGIMRSFTKALGTRCDHCHVNTPGGGERDFDFASDAKPEKKAARVMLKMVRTINNDYIQKVDAHGEAVMCVTCHRGRTIPDLSFVQPPPEHGAPAQAPPANPPANPPS